jgi:hypothetical protein
MKKAGLHNLIVIAIGVFVTVLGAWVINGLFLIWFAGITFSGHSLAITETAIFGAWYLAVSASMAKFSKNINAALFGIAGFTIACILILSTEGWFDSSMSLAQKAVTWLEVYAPYLVAFPTFYIVGRFCERTLNHKPPNNGLNHDAAKQRGAG